MQSDNGEFVMSRLYRDLQEKNLPDRNRGEQLKTQA
jgi:hypothetical protein